MAKRIIGLFLALCLVVGLLPMMAMAEDETTTVTAYLTVTTGDHATKIQFKPTMAEGMAPAYAKTTAEGALVLEGATANDYNLKAEWPVGGKPTLTLNSATLNNDTIHPNDNDPACIHAINADGTADWEILLKGTNAINLNHALKGTELSSTRVAHGIRGNNSGSLTIKSADSKVDTLTIDSYGGVSIYKAFAALIIDSANISIIMRNTARNPQSAIEMAYDRAGYEDKNTLTVKDSYFNISNPGKFSNYYILMGKAGGYNATNVSDILFQNSKIVLNRNNGSSFNSSGSEGIRFNGTQATWTIDNCDLEIYGNHRTANYAPSFVNCAKAEMRDSWSTWSAYAHIAGTALTSNTNNSAFRSTHTCVAGEPVLEKSAGACTEHAYNVTYCSAHFCGKELSREEIKLESTMIHTPGNKTLLSKVDAKYEGTGSFNSSNQEYQRIVEGTYTWQYTCSVCGEVWTEEENFKPAILNYISSGEGAANQNSYSSNNTSASYKVTLRQPGYVVYFVTKANSDNYPDNRYMVAATADEIAAGTWNVKFEYPVGGNPVLTLKNANIINNTGLWYGYAGWYNLAPLTIVLEGNNSIKQTLDSQGVAPLILNTNNDVTINGTEGSSLYLESHSITGALTTVNGNLTMNDVNLTLVRTDSNPTSTREDPAIGSRGNGNVTINGGSITYAGFGRNGTLSSGSKYSRSGYNHLIRGNNITLNNANITAHGTFGNKAGNIYAKGDLVVNESTLFIAHGFAYTENNQTIYGDAFKCSGTATFNYANGVTGQYSTGTTYVDAHVDWTTVTYPSSKTDITTIAKLETLVTSSEYVRYLDIKPVKALAKFEATAVTVTDDLTLEFAVLAEKITDGSIAYITRNGVTTELALTEAYKEGDYYVIPCTGISAKEMHDQVTVVIKDAEGNTITETKTDSVYDYTVRMLRKAENAKDTKLLTVLVDMLNYGAMAQIQFNHNTENLANKVLTPSEWTYATAEMAATPATPATVEGAEATVHLGTTFELNTNIAMLIAVEGNATSAKVYVDGEYKETVTAVAYNGFVIFTFNGMNAADGRKDIKFEVYTGETLTLTVTDSLAGYVGRNVEAYPYLENLMKYCDAAAAYFNA